MKLVVTPYLIGLLPLVCDVFRQRIMIDINILDRYSSIQILQEPLFSARLHC